MANTNKGLGVEPPREPGQELERVKKPYKDMVVGPLNQKPDMATPTPVSELGYWTSGGTGG